MLLLLLLTILLLLIITFVLPHVELLELFHVAHITALLSHLLPDLLLFLLLLLLLGLLLLVPHDLRISLLPLHEIRLLVLCGLLL